VRPLQVVAGNFASGLLAYFGADVIKVEPPGRGDALRHLRMLDDSGTSLWWRSYVSWGSCTALCCAALAVGRGGGAIAGPPQLHAVAWQHPRGDRAAPVQPRPHSGHAYATEPHWCVTTAACGAHLQGRNRRCITVDLHNEEGRALVRRLAECMDVLVENFRPGGRAGHHPPHG
jgi:hypothetical protein